MTTSTYVPDPQASLRDSFSLHLDATRAATTSRIYLAALDSLIAHLTTTGMPLTARAIRRERSGASTSSLGSSPAGRPWGRRRSRSSTRALVQFWKWAVEENEIDASSMAKMKGPRVLETPLPVVEAAEWATGTTSFGTPWRAQHRASIDDRHGGQRAQHSTRPRADRVCRYEPPCAGRLRPRRRPPSACSLRGDRRLQCDAGGRVCRVMALRHREGKDCAARDGDVVVPSWV